MVKGNNTVMTGSLSANASLVELKTAFYRCILLCLASVMFMGPALNAKEKDTRPKRTVKGLVSDASDNPISGATVMLTDLTDGKQLASYTGEDGTYSFSSLDMTNDYEVQATYKGVSSRVRKVSMIDTRTRITLNLQIPPPNEE